MNRNSLILAAGLALALPATGAMAQQSSVTGISWSYFDIAAQHVSPDESALESNTGLALRGSGMINPNWHLFLGWNRGKLEGGTHIGDNEIAIDEDINRFHFGLGYNLPVAARTDLFARVAYERVSSADFLVTTPAGVIGGELEGTEGYSLEVGVRSALGRNWEVGGSLRHIFMDDPEATIGAGDAINIGGLVDDDHTALVLNGQYKFNNGWGVIAEADVGSAYQSLLLGVRLSY
ncbi:MAG: porin family protein [Xanthomonadales bacterium]|nr:porin family protein [Xanthomonadales bacterium]